MEFGPVTNWKTVLTGVRDRLLAAPLSWPSSSLLVSLSSRGQLTKYAPQKLVLVARPTSGQQALDIVAGAAHSVVQGRIEVSLYYRQVSDPYSRDADLLLASGSLLDRWQSVLDQLHLATLDTAGVSILVEPMRFLTWRVSDREGGEWGQLESEWEVVFRQR